MCDIWVKLGNIRKQMQAIGCLLSVEAKDLFAAGPSRLAVSRRRRFAADAARLLASTLKADLAAREPR